MPIIEKSDIQFKISQFYFGLNAQIRIFPDLRNSKNHRIASASFETLQNIILLRINRSQVPVICGQQIGSLFAAFPPTQEVLIEIFLMDKLFLSKTLFPTDSFQQSSKAQIIENKITALSYSTFYSARSLINGVGQFSIQLNELCLCGVCLVNQRHVLFGAQVNGHVRLVSDGDNLEMLFGKDEKRVIEGLEREEVVLFVRLKAGRSAELYPIKNNQDDDELSNRV
eukprot:EST45106.1 Hypothetical protein SS50377_15126 [Spironucleus salmonicida]